MVISFYFHQVFFDFRSTGQQNTDYTKTTEHKLQTQVNTLICDGSRSETYELKKSKKAILEKNRKTKI